MNKLRDVTEMEYIAKAFYIGGGGGVQIRSTKQNNWAVSATLKTTSCRDANFVVTCDTTGLS